MPDKTEAREREERAPQRPQREMSRIFRAEVTAVMDLTPHLRRLTIHAPELADYETVGPDEYLGLILPRSEADPLVLPDASNPAAIRAAVAELPEDVRPDLRWYTVREHRPEASELDIDFVVHGDEGPGSRFALRARTGSVLGVRECSALYALPDGARTRVLIGDESSLPAIARILEMTLDEPEPYVFIETADPRDRMELAAPVRWVDRVGEPGVALEAAVRASTLPDEVDYAWVCGERVGVQNIRRHLVADRGVAKSRITFSGYWRLGEVRA